MPTEKAKRKIKPIEKKTHKKSTILKKSSSSFASRAKNFLQRRPHRSFRMTKRRDYTRPLTMPGYWSFTAYVVGILWKHKKLFLLLTLSYALLSGMLVGIGSQDIYALLVTGLNENSGDFLKDQWGQISSGADLLTTLLSGALNGTLTEVQLLYSGILVLLLWLTTVWLLRSILAGRSPRLRDGLYNSGAPILPTFLVTMVVFVQLLPAAVAGIGIATAIRTDVLDTGIFSMLIWTIALLLTLLSLYWVTSTIFALVVVTLPGMYPLQALKTAGDLVIGRRVRILLRLLWLGVTSIIFWFVAMIPVILFDSWIKTVVPAIKSLPIVPMTLLFVSSLVVIWAASYMYLLYRKVVDDDASPA